MITLPATIVAIAIVTPPMKSRNLSTTHENGTPTPFILDGTFQTERSNRLHLPNTGHFRHLKRPAVCVTESHADQC